ELLDDLEAPFPLRRVHLEPWRDEGAELRRVAGTRVLGHRLALAVAAAQPPSFQRAPDDCPETVRLTHREDLPLRLARENRVRRLRRDESFERAPFAQPERLDHLPAAEVQRARLDECTGRNPQVADLPLMDEVAERAERFLERRVPVVAVNLVEVDPVRPQPPEALLDLE